MNPILRVKRKLIRTFFYEQWCLLVCDLNGAILTVITPEHGVQWADPFPVEHNGKTYIFLEQQIGSENGTLGFIELYHDLTCSTFTPILEKKYHLSFPNIFSLEENNHKIWYMIPETHENRTIDLYRAVDFPLKWNYDFTLMKDIVAVDSTVFQYASKWWLFTSLEKKPASMNRNLSAFFSDSFPSADWKPHPLNPLCSDISNSRMAGAVFFNEKTGLLNRPAQNCRKDYGRETNINEIVELNTSSYNEKISRTIFPEKNLHAVCTHTYNYSDNYMLRDIKTRNVRFQKFKKMKNEFTGRIFKQPG
jgi:hypothetical protein